MKVLLLSGLGNSHKNASYTGDGLLFGPPSKLSAELETLGIPSLEPSALRFTSEGYSRALLRPPPGSPHLTTMTLQGILIANDIAFQHVDLSEIWKNSEVKLDGDIDVVLLSTTYIWNRAMMAQAVHWCATHLPGIRIVAGGQYTNLKFATVLGDHPELYAVVRGDGEAAIPALIQVLRLNSDLGHVPNLVYRQSGQLILNKLTYVDINEVETPDTQGSTSMPYESMRGCPFDCKFCSFPAASPKWRYKSADKIIGDWEGYAHVGVQQIEAMDSTFTVPPTRFRSLLSLLSHANVPSWSAYSRANTISGAAVVEQLLAAKCSHLEIGFESMNANTLKRMSKRVTVAQNRKAFDSLRSADLSYGICFMVGYPGETPEDYEETHDFIVNEFEGRFSLQVFSVADETMPLWADRDPLKISVEDPFDPDSSWAHIGMTSDEARYLQRETFDAVRRKNSLAQPSIWQRDFERPFAESRSRQDNVRIEKALERIEKAGEDSNGGAAACAEIVREQLRVLKAMGVTLAEDRSLS